MKELKAAAERSHMQVVEYLRPRMREIQVGPALEAAAANGDLPVIEALLPDPLLMDRILAAAASNGHVHVVQLLLDDRAHLYVFVVLQNAAKFGHIPVMELVIDRCAMRDIKSAMTAAAGRVRRRR